PVHRHLLPLPALLIGRGHRARAIAVETTRDPEHLFAQLDQLLVRRAPEGAKGLQVVDRLEKIGLPLGVVPYECEPLRRDLELLASQVPEVPELDAAQVHPATAGAGRFSMQEFNIFAGPTPPAVRTRKGLDRPGFSGLSGRASPD